MLLTDPDLETAPVGTPFRVLLDLVPAAAYTCDADGRITYFNHHAAALWGRTPRLNDSGDRFCGSHRLLNSAGEPVSHADCWMAKALREARDFAGREITVERPDGSRRHALVHAGPTRAADGTVEGAVNVMLDITGQKDAQALEAEAGHRKDVFLATLAHELRNPLAPIRTAVPILRRAALASDAGAVLDMVERQVDHLVRLVDDLLEASRITRGKLVLRKQRVEIAAVVGIAVETSRSRIEAAGHALHIHSLAEPAWLDADPLRLAQVIASLLDNAAKFTPPGGRIDLLLDRDEGMLRLRVQDSGAGIHPDALPQVFDLFMQEERWVGMQAGLGVGLALVRNLVELHGGSVCARSDGEGKGAEFTVRLPLAAPDPADGRPRAAEALDPDAAPLSAAQQRVLVVDDNHDAAESLAMLVELLGNIAHVSFGGREALDACPQFRPTIVLLDLSMPGISGFEVARRLRELPGGAELRLVALSGRSEDEFRRRSDDAGFDAHLVKPVDLPTLQAVLAGHPPM
jgi:PAS domain S-box-containing protein